MKAKEKKYNYFYIINNLVNGHFYLGIHTTNKMDDGYFGSGTVLKAAIKKYGKENFEMTPLIFFGTRKELVNFEAEVVNERFLAYYKGICYNLKRGGEGGTVKRFTDEELKEHRREYKKKHRDNLREYNRQYNREYSKREKNKEYRREYREQNKDYFKEYGKNYCRQNKERRKKYWKRYYQRKKSESAS